MSEAEDLARRTAVRHKEAGHLRLELPPELCLEARAAALETGLRQTAGVYRVTLERLNRKLSIRFDPHLASIHEVALRLRQLLEDLPVADAAILPPPADQPPPASPLAGARHAVEDGLRRLGEWRRLTFARLQQQTPEGSLQARIQPMLASALTEKAILNFLNDLVAFYLIKAHWDLIANRWIKEPLKYRNAWLTTFYLVFLLVRYRKQNPNK
jgi:hypothetical protein